MEFNKQQIPNEYEFFLNKKTEKIYMSKSFDVPQTILSEEGFLEIIRPMRIISKVIIGEQHQFIKEKGEIVLRITPNGKQEIKAKFYEDSRGILTLQIQKYSTDTGNPHNAYFTFREDEIGKLYNFIRNIPLLPIKGKEGQHFDEKFLNEIILSKQDLLRFILEKSNEDIADIITELQKHSIGQDDIKGLAYKKDQLEVFKNMLYCENYFENKKVESKFDKDERVWQDFFEKNTWILGYGLNYIFNSELDEKKLEQVIKGYDFYSAGKRIDLLMKTNGLINSLCFGEIKTHKTPLLKQIQDSYRKECWMIDTELAGGVAQIQKTVQKAIENIKTKTEITDNYGDLTGEQLYLYQPKSFLLIGSLKEFISKNDRINEIKFSSFELFRKNMFNPEIITFDELYERAKHIINPISK